MRLISWTLRSCIEQVRSQYRVTTDSNPMNSLLTDEVRAISVLT
jgi:hypothetical protein